MDYMLDDEWFNKPKIHTIDALCATGSRINRWLTELPKEKAESCKSLVQIWMKKRWNMLSKIAQVLSSAMKIHAKCYSRPVGNGSTSTPSDPQFRFSIPPCNRVRAEQSWKSPQPIQLL